MTDPVTTAAGIHAVKKLIDWVTSKGSEDPAATQLVMDAQSQIIELQQAIYDRDTKIREQEDELRKLQYLGDLEYHDECYWEKEGDGWAGPFCSACKENSEKKIHVNFPHPYKKVPQCTVCQHWGEIENPRPPE